MQTRLLQMESYKPGIYMVTTATKSQQIYFHPLLCQFLGEGHLDPYMVCQILCPVPIAFLLSYVLTF